MKSDDANDAVPLRIGARGSRLAMIQATMVRDALGAYVDDPPELKIIRTEGDRRRDVPLATIGGKGLFIKDIEQALLRNDIDLAVHSCKDIPATIEDAFEIGAVLPRADVRDVLITRQGESLAQLKQGARVGTGSLRRRALLLSVRPDLAIFDLRGNVDTRVNKLRAGDYDGIVLAAAAIERIGGLTGVACTFLGEPEFLPAPAQGAIAIEIRVDDRTTAAVVGMLDHRETRYEVETERAFLKVLGGDCNVPVAARARVDGGTIGLQGLVAALDGRTIVRDAATAPVEKRLDMARELALKIKAAGGGAIIEGIDRGRG